MKTDFVNGWVAALDAAASHYEGLAEQWSASARSRNHDDPGRAEERTMAAWWRNTAAFLRGLASNPKEPRSSSRSANTGFGRP
ncbi:MAG: hypothetical protein AB7P08_17095 [Burkholderiales bacterium]